MREVPADRVRPRNEKGPHRLGIVSSAFHLSNGDQKESLCTFKMTWWFINKEKHNLLTDFVELEFKTMSSCLCWETVPRGTFGLSATVACVCVIVIPSLACQGSGEYFGGWPIGKK